MGGVSCVDQNMKQVAARRTTKGSVNALWSVLQLQTEGIQSHYNLAALKGYPVRTTLRVCMCVCPCASVRAARSSSAPAGGGWAGAGCWGAAAVAALQVIERRAARVECLCTSQPSLAASAIGQRQPLAAFGARLLGTTADRMACDCDVRTHTHACRFQFDLSSEEEAVLSSCLSPVVRDDVEVRAGVNVEAGGTRTLAVLEAAVACCRVCNMCPVRPVDARLLCGGQPPVHIHVVLLHAWSMLHAGGVGGDHRGCHDPAAAQLPGAVYTRRCRHRDTPHRWPAVGGNHPAPHEAHRVGV